MSKEEFFKKYKEIILKTNGSNDDYVVAICQISNLINEFANEQEKQLIDLQSQLALTEKALELACNELDIYCTPEGNSIKEDFIEMAKEMINNDRFRN